MKDHYDVIIVGGGIIGTSLLYTLANFSDIKKILLIEKNYDIALSTSSSRNNAQTLHVGDIETNYNLQKVIETKAASEMLLEYTKMLDKKKSSGTIFPVSKMVLGVGEEEVEAIEKRYDKKFLSLFDHIKKVQKKEIGKLEPAVVKGRDPREKIIGAYSPTGYMINFGKVARSFVDSSKNKKDKEIDIHLNETAKKVSEKRNVYELITNKNIYAANFIVFATGGYSLYFAKSLLYAQDLSVLSVGGNFYYSKKVLNGKVYRVQKGNIPFAAVHGDPDIDYPNRSRFGPTIDIVPFLEKADLGTTFDYIKTAGLDKDAIESLLHIISDRDIIEIMAKNVAYSMPELGKFIFVKEEVNKIVPTLKHEDLVPDPNAGGIRPQIIDKKNKKLLLGEIEVKKDGLIFVMAPSPGASSCLKVALNDSLQITDYLGRKFHKEKFLNMFTKNEKQRKAILNSLKK